MQNSQLINRRSFLISLGGLTLSQLLVGCAGNNQTKLNVQLLKGSIPVQVVNQFTQGLKSKPQLKFAPVEQIQEVYKRLQAWEQNPNSTDEPLWTRVIPFRKTQSFAVADLVTLGDYWLTTAIERKLIKPLPISDLKQWNSLDARWQQLVTRNDKGLPDAQGKVWAAPYRWGATVIVYDREKFKKLGWTPQDWSDLWRNELRDRISIVDQPREVIGLVLKKLGKSYNTADLATVPDLEKELKNFNQQVKIYSSTSYLEPLLIGDTWLAVGWSNDIIPLLSRYPQLSAVVPSSGTAMFADLWVSPKEIPKDDLSSQWIDFCWQPKIAKQISLLTKTNSPVTTDIKPSEIEDSFPNLLVNRQEIFSKGEFLLPLPPEAMDKYESLFKKMKTGNWS